MSVRPVKYSESHRAEWNSFASASFNGTFLHSREFYDHNPANQRDDHSLMFYDDKKLVALLPCTEGQVSSGKSLTSHLRATYGGLLLAKGMGVEETEKIVGALVTYGKENGIQEISIRHPFRFLSEESPDQIDFLLARAGFVLDYRDLEFAVKTKDISQSLDDTKIINGKTRNQIRKALSSDLKFQKSEKWADYWNLLETNLREKYQTKPVHDLASMQTLIQKVGANKITLWTAEFGKSLAAGIVIFHVTPKVDHFQYVASDLEHKDKCPLNGLYWQIMLEAKQKGIDVVNFGSATTSRGANINSGLVHFKEGFGAQGFLREQVIYRLR